MMLDFDSQWQNPRIPFRVCRLIQTLTTMKFRFNLVNFAFSIVSSKQATSDTGDTSHGGASLVFRLKENDSQAWSELVTLYGPLIFHWCQVCNLDSADSADVMQIVFENVSRKINRFQTHLSGTFRGWLWRITQNKVRCRSKFESHRTI